VHSKLLDCAAQGKCKNYIQMHPLSRNWSNSDFLLDAAIAELVEELPNYLAIADGVAIETEEGKVKWWSDHEMAFPSWSTSVKKILSPSRRREAPCEGTNSPGYLHSGKRKH
jgi:hypothetical protein